MPYYSSDRLSSNRLENSLFSLTKKFFLFLKQTYPRPINTNNLASYLCVSKRRVYDVTNILEGLGYLKKRSVNSLEWIGGDFNQFISSDEDNSEEQKSNENHILIEHESQEEKENHNPMDQKLKMNRENAELNEKHQVEENNVAFIEAGSYKDTSLPEEMVKSLDEQTLEIAESRLDQEIDEANTSVQRMLQNETSITNAYVNKNDLLNIETLADKLIFVVKAPHETFLENKDTPGEYAIEMNVNNDKIDVYFISDEDKKNL